MDSRGKLRHWHQTIRANFLEEYFRNVRKEKLRQSREVQSSQNIEKFIKNFTKDLEKIVKQNISGQFVERLRYAPYDWIKNCKKWLNMRQWSCFLQLILQILAKNVESKDRFQLLQFSKDIICIDFKKRLLDNKLMKRHILMLFLDLTLQMTEQLIVMQGDYLNTLKIVIDELFSQNFQFYQQQLIKLFVILNRFTFINQSAIQKMVQQLFIKEKWATLKALTFIEQFGFNLSNQQTVVLIRIILIFFINLTQQTKDKTLYQIFQKNPFLQIITNIFQFPTDFDPEIRKLCFKLVFNLIIQSNQIAAFISKLGDINQLQTKVSTEEQQILLNEIKTLLQQPK